MPRARAKFSVPVKQRTVNRELIKQSRRTCPIPCEQEGAAVLGSFGQDVEVCVCLHVFRSVSLKNLNYSEPIQLVACAGLPVDVRTVPLRQHQLHAPLQQVGWTHGETRQPSGDEEVDAYK